VAKLGTITVKIFFRKALKNYFIDPIFAAPISSLLPSETLVKEGEWIVRLRQGYGGQ